MMTVHAAMPVTHTIIYLVLSDNHLMLCQGNKFADLATHFA